MIVNDHVTAQFFQRNWRLFQLPGYAGVIVWDPGSNYLAFVSEVLMEQLNEVLGSDEVMTLRELVENEIRRNEK